jgi:hypothetical protein
LNSYHNNILNFRIKIYPLLLIFKLSVSAYLYKSLIIQIICDYGNLYIYFSKKIYTKWWENNIWNSFLSYIALSCGQFLNRFSYSLIKFLSRYPSLVSHRSFIKVPFEYLRTTCTINLIKHQVFVLPGFPDSTNRQGSQSQFL